MTEAYDKHMERSTVLQSILALWAENPDLSLLEVFNKFELFLTDEAIVEKAKSHLSPKSLHFMVQVNPTDTHILNGKDRHLVSENELGPFVSSLKGFGNETMLYITAKYFNEVEAAGVRDFIDSMTLPEKVEDQKG